MGKPEFSSSEHFLPPKTLAERLKAHANSQAEIEAASFMAERFAPERIVNNFLDLAMEAHRRRPAVEAAPVI